MTDVRQDLLDTIAKPPPPPSELDELMSRDPLELTSQDIDKIIAMQRQMRARREAPAKGKKATADSGPSGIDLVALVRGVAPAPAAKVAPTATKPGSGFRRI